MQRPLVAAESQGGRGTGAASTVAFVPSVLGPWEGLKLRDSGPTWDGGNPQGCQVRKQQASLVVTAAVRQVRGDSDHSCPGTWCRHRWGSWAWPRWWAREEEW